MSDLLSPGDWAEFKAAIKDVTDTFFKVPVVLKKKTRTYGAFNENKEDETSNEDINLMGLLVYDKDGSGAVNTQREIGSANLTQGYIYFNVEDLDANNLIDGTTKDCLINTTIDEAEFLGVLYNLSGGELVGPLNGEFALYKIHFERVYKNK